MILCLSCLASGNRCANIIFAEMLATSGLPKVPSRIDALDLSLRCVKSCREKIQVTYKQATCQAKFERLHVLYKHLHGTRALIEQVLFFPSLRLKTGVHFDGLGNNKRRFSNSKRLVAKVRTHFAPQIEWFKGG